MLSAHNGQDSQLPSILLVDSDPLMRGYFFRLFDRHYRVLMAENSSEALKVFRLHAHQIGVIVIGDTICDLEDVLISNISLNYPEIIKILTKNFLEIDLVIGFNSHHANFRYITKPWDIPQLESILFLATELFAVKRRLTEMRDDKVRALEKVLLSSRFSAYVLAPVSAGIACKHAGEAVASFVQTGVTCRHFEIHGVNPQPGWARLHAEQVALARDLERRLPIALCDACLTKRTVALAIELEAAGAHGASGSGFHWNGNTTLIVSDVDPIPAFLVARMEDQAVRKMAVRVIAAYMAIYDFGGVIRRVDADGLMLEITAVPDSLECVPSRERVSEWLVDDDLLVKEAVALH